MFKCPNCSGSMYFDIASQMLKCRHCDTSLNVTDYHVDNAAQENTEDGMIIYTCQNCGAQLISADSHAVAFCSYCDNQQILESRLNEYERPYKLIPFRISKNKCKDLYHKKLNSHIYAPKEFKDPEFIDKFRGIYIPYWNYHVSFDNSPLKMKGYSRYSISDYTYEEKYNLTTEVNGLDKAAFYDASSNFDDTIAETIEPFNARDFVDYNDGYLAGFYADVADVDARQYEKNVIDYASLEAKENIAKAYGRKRISPKLPSNNKLKEFLGTRIADTNTYLFPVWFLTWRKKDRVAYAVVNGQTGKITSDIPVDSLRFLGITGICAAILFVILTLFVTMTAATALFVSSFIAWIVSYIYRKEIMNIHDRENHIFDKGFFIEGRDSEITFEKAQRIAKRRKFTLFQKIFGVIMGFTLALIATIYFLDYEGTLIPADKAAMCCTLLIIPAAWNFLRTISFVGHMEEKSLIIEALTCFAGIVIAWFILLIQPVEDWYYYLGCLICLTGVLITCFGLINKYNILATRAVPELFDRTGGNDSEKY